MLLESGWRFECTYCGHLIGNDDDDDYFDVVVDRGHHVFCNHDSPTVTRKLHSTLYYVIVQHLAIEVNTTPYRKHIGGQYRGEKKTSNGA